MAGPRRMPEPAERGGRIARDAVSVEQILSVDGLRVDDPMIGRRRDPRGGALGGPARMSANARGDTDASAFSETASIDQ